MRSLIRLAKIFVLICALFVLTTTGTSEIHAANIHLTWEDTSDNAVGFKIERVVAGVANGTFTVGANSTSYVDSGLSPGIVYCYLVRAYNSAGDSDPSNEVCAAAEETTTVSPTTKITPVASLVVSPTTVAAGRTIGTVWSGIAVPSPTDWIGLYVPGADETSFIDYIYVSCSRIADSTARASGSCSYPLPANLNGGNYELRLFANRGFTRLATSNAFAIGAEITPVPSLAVSPTTVAAGRTIGTLWSGIAVPSPTDWIGLYVPGADETSFIDYIYVSCSRIADSTARASGSCSYPLPANLNGGNYELRLFANRGFTRLATSNSFTAPVTPGVPVGPPGGPSGLTIQILQ